MAICYAHSMSSIAYNCIHRGAGRVFCLAVLFLAVPNAAWSQPEKPALGTLFYSPDERTAIIAARKEQSGVVVQSGTTISVGGLVRRASGKGTAWINGQVVAEGQAVPAAGVPVIEPRRVLVDGHSVRVRETVDIETGSRSDALPLGALTVKKQR